VAVMKDLALAFYAAGSLCFLVGTILTWLAGR
jgi:hypothetical protein